MRGDSKSHMRGDLDPARPPGEYTPAPYSHQERPRKGMPGHHETHTRGDRDHSTQRQTWRGDPSRRDRSTHTWVPRRWRRQRALARETTILASPRVNMETEQGPRIAPTKDMK